MITPTPTDTQAAGVSIAQKIENHLAAKGIPRTDIHAAAGISRPTFNAKMADASRFTVNELIRIAARIGIPTYEILPEELTRREAA